MRPPPRSPCLPLAFHTAEDALGKRLPELRIQCCGEYKKEGLLPCLHGPDSCFGGARYPLFGTLSQYLSPHFQRPAVTPQDSLQGFCASLLLQLRQRL